MKHRILFAITAFLGLSFGNAFAVAEDFSAGNVNDINARCGHHHVDRCCPASSGSTGQRGPRGFPGSTGPTGPTGATGVGVTDTFASLRSTGILTVVAGQTIIFPPPLSSDFSGITYDSLTGVFTVPEAGSYQISFGFSASGIDTAILGAINIEVDGAPLSGSAIGALGGRNAGITLIADVANTISLTADTSFIIQALSENLVSIYIEIVRLDD